MINCNFRPTSEQNKSQNMGFKAIPLFSNLNKAEIRKLAQQTETTAQNIKDLQKGLMKFFKEDDAAGKQLLDKMYGKNECVNIGLTRYFMHMKLNLKSENNGIEHNFNFDHKQPLNTVLDSLKEKLADKLRK